MTNQESWVVVGAIKVYIMLVEIGEGCGGGLLRGSIFSRFSEGERIKEERVTVILLPP